MCHHLLGDHFYVLFLQTLITAAKAHCGTLFLIYDGINKIEIVANIPGSSLAVHKSDIYGDRGIVFWLCRIS